MVLEKIRRDYKLAELNENSVDKNPLKQFTTWMEEALLSNIHDATAMSLNTNGTDGFPQSRIVLLKNFSEKGFTFFTNYNSEKGKAIAANNKIGLHFFWSELERQIRISGFAEKTSREISSKYFHSRPQKSQVAASVSEQSSIIPSRNFLELKFAEEMEKLNGANPNLPKDWGGYLVKPTKYEFWQGRESRLHDRLIYVRKGDSWVTKRLAP